MSTTPLVTSLRVIPVAGRDSMLLNLSGAHGPLFGYGFEIEFAEPVQGPIALGYGCHFGLGQFHGA